MNNTINNSTSIADPPCNRIIDAVSPVREEGDSTVTPVVGETVGVGRRLFLKEEARLRKVRVTEQYPKKITLRDQDVTVTRTALDEGYTDFVPSPSKPSSTSNQG